MGEGVVGGFFFVVGVSGAGDEVFVVGFSKYFCAFLCENISSCFDEEKELLERLSTHVLLVLFSPSFSSCGKYTKGI